MPEWRDNGTLLERVLRYAEESIVQVDTEEYRRLTANLLPNWTRRRKSAVGLARVAMAQVFGAASCGDWPRCARTAAGGTADPGGGQEPGRLGDRAQGAFAERRHRTGRQGRMSRALTWLATGSSRGATVLCTPVSAQSGIAGWSEPVVLTPNANDAISARLRRRMWRCILRRVVSVEGRGETSMSSIYYTSWDGGSWSLPVEVAGLARRCHSTRPLLSHPTASWSWPGRREPTAIGNGAEQCGQQRPGLAHYRDGAGDESHAGLLSPT